MLKALIFIPFLCEPAPNPLTSFFLCVLCVLCGSFFFLILKHGLAHLHTELVLAIKVYLSIILSVSRHSLSTLPNNIQKVQITPSIFRKYHDVIYNFQDIKL